MANFNHTAQAHELALINFIAVQQLSVIAKIAQEPVEFPECFRAAIEPAGQNVVRESARFNHSESDSVVLFRCIWTKLHPLNANQENPIRSQANSGAIRRT